MWKYLFLVFILVGCSNNSVIKTTKQTKQKDEKYLLLKGANLYSLNKKSEALKVYQQVLKLNKQNQIALREKAIIEAQLGNINQAEKDLELALKIDSTDNLILKNLAYLNFEKKNYNKSSEYLNRISLDFRNDQDYYILGYIEFINKNYVNSLKYYEYVNSEEIFNKTLFFESYLKNLKQLKITSENSYLKLEDKIKYNKKNTIKLVEYYETNFINTNFSERVLKNYLVYNEVDIDIINKLASIYDKNGNKENYKKVLNLISN
ncbi:MULTISPECIES: tetratricopeptide repeat protein [Cetobacterium]|uniref:Tetratricopeptide repeat protein n=1 Tax=Candidatus Cetobacterium colombiensis TaxID=3073100 RepID=A0ABU4W9P4_9FUSO|nr:hypothetical protein [Candidatus Cetobacterium colombiensis]MDX8336241.1 hypothetical protein [Candidatus Cetobacterium colombiensis]